MRLAFFSPLPPAETGIANYSELLIGAINSLAEIVVVTPGPARPNGNWARQLEFVSDDDFRGPWHHGCQTCLYQMGNNLRFHRWIYQRALRYPGFVTLHDLNLHSFYGELFLESDRRGAYLKELAYGGGKRGLDQGIAALLGRSAHPVFQYPMFERLVDISLGTITHSKYARRQVLKRRPRAHVEHIDLLTTLPQDNSSSRNPTNVQPSDLLLASFGHLGPEKRLAIVLQAVATLRQRFPRLRYVIVGKPVPGYDLASLVNRLGLEDIVSLAGYLEKDTYMAYMNRADIGINLRHPTRGESSATLVELMASATPTLVSEADAFREIPDSVVVKIPTDDTELDRLVSALEWLLADPAGRRTLGLDGQKYVRERGDPARVAQNYLNFIDRRLAAVAGHFQGSRHAL